jgi:hypothetical protein
MIAERLDALLRLDVLVILRDELPDAADLVFHHRSSRFVPAYRRSPVS